MNRLRDGQHPPVSVDGESGLQGSPLKPSAEPSARIAAARETVESWMANNLYTTLIIGVSCGVVLGWFIKRHK